MDINIANSLTTDGQALSLEGAVYITVPQGVTDDERIALAAATTAAANNIQGIMEKIRERLNTPTRAPSPFPGEAYNFEQAEPAGPNPNYEGGTGLRPERHNIAGADPLTPLQKMNLEHPLSPFAEKADLNKKVILATSYGKDGHFQGLVEKGMIVGIATYTNRPDQYLIRYRAGDGRQCEGWFDRDAFGISAE